MTPLYADHAPSDTQLPSKLPKKPRT